MLLLTAARCRLPAEAYFACLTATWLYGMDVPATSPIEVTVRPEVGVSGRAGVKVYRADIRDDDVTERRNLPVTSILRTIADIAYHYPLVEAVVIADMALHAKLTTVQALADYNAARAGKKGSARLRRVVGLAEPAAESAMESRLRMLLIEHGLPRPLAQVPIFGVDSQFAGRLDLLYPQQRLGLEYDGQTHRENRTKDNRRQNLLTNAGIRLLRFTRPDILDSPDATAAQVRAALAA